MREAFQVLRSYLEARATLSEQDFAFIEPLFIYKKVSSGEFIQRAGDIATHAVFVAKGCLRSYVLDSNGKEHIVQFAPETWWLADANSLRDNTPSQYFVDAIEDSHLLLIDSPSHQSIVQHVPGYAKAFMAGLQKHAAAKDERIVHSLSATAEERYLEFLQTYPSIVTRVPQWMLASYLGLTPETLSRIRRKLSRK